MESIMKLYSFNYSTSTEVPSTPTIISFVRAMIKMKKLDREMFTGIDVMKYALDNGLWTTKQTTEKQMMTTWAFYLKTLKEIGLVECGVVEGGRKVVSISELLKLEDEDETEEELSDEELEEMTQPE